MRKTLILVILLPFISFSQKIYTVNYASQADLKVYVVNYASQADLKTYKVDYASQVTRNEGRWHFVDYASQADLKIYFVDYVSQAGWTNKSKKHLLY